ncbi:MAG: tetratricopeptide repeat protein [Alphaproteobacteria bacterium]|nr:tetratricopeptide repeat protein [Alphaproteobacteria bacterium]
MSGTDADRAFAEAARLHRAGHAAAAFRMAARAVDLDPGHADAAIEYARMLAAARRGREAERVLRGALDRNPGHFALASTLGVMLAAEGRAAEAVEPLRRAAALRPDLAVGSYNLANALKAAGRLTEAEDAYRAAIARDATLAAAHGNLGNTLALLGRVAEAGDAHERATLLRRGPDARPAAGDKLFRMTSEGKLRHDIEQLDHLIQRGEALEAERKLYRAALADLPPPAPGTHIVELPARHAAALARTYNRLWHRIEAPALPGGALNPALDRMGIEADYARNAPGIAQLDGLLRPEALESLRRFCLESTIWYQFAYANGYLGAFWEQGFWCPLLAQIAEELRLALPGIFGPHRLRKLWAFKYDSRLSGIPMHADFAAVNVNFWITPDAANLDPDRGGLVVWDKEAPADWDFQAYNTDLPAMRRFLDETGAKPVRIPHRQNRAAIFNSDLFHETDTIRFAEGYANRRINITLLYGARNAG